MTKQQTDAVTCQEELEAALALVAQAGLMLVDEAKRPGGPRGSNAKAPVDAEIETFLAEALANRFPTHGLLCEELDSNNHAETGSGRTFLVDPHDGTRDFLAGHRETSVSLALVEGGRLLLGIVHAPLPSPLTGPGFTLHCVAGGPLHLDGAPLDLPPVRDSLDEESVVLVSRQMKRMGLKQNQRLLQPAQVVPCSSIATRFALVAMGRADAALTIWNPLAPWDFAAGQLLLQVAGGDVVDANGLPIAWEGGRPAHHASEGYFGARTLPMATETAARFAPMTAAAWSNE